MCRKINKKGLMHHFCETLNPKLDCVQKNQEEGA